MKSPMIPKISASFPSCSPGDSPTWAAATESDSPPGGGGIGGGGIDVTTVSLDRRRILDRAAVVSRPWF